MPESLEGAKFESGDSAIVNTEGGPGIYDGVEVDILEVHESPDGFWYYCALPGGYYNKIVQIAGGTLGYPWHEPGTNAGFLESQLLEHDHDDAPAILEQATAVSEDARDFLGGGE